MIISNILVTTKVNSICKCSSKLVHYYGKYFSVPMSVTDQDHNLPGKFMGDYIICLINNNLVLCIS